MLTLHILNNIVKWAFLFMIMNLVGKSNFIPHVVAPLTVSHSYAKPDFRSQIQSYNLDT